MEKTFNKDSVAGESFETSIKHMRSGVFGQGMYNKGFSVASRRASIKARKADARIAELRAEIEAKDKRIKELGEINSLFNELLSEIKTIPYGLTKVEAIKRIIKCHESP